MLYKNTGSNSRLAGVLYKNFRVLQKTETLHLRLPRNYFVELEANRSKPIVKIEVIHFKIVGVLFDPIIKVIEESRVIISRS